MSINIGPASGDDLRPRITVIGVGGAGGNAIANMMEAEVEGVDFIVANTDAQALSNSSAEQRIQLGPDITGGLGAGARPEVGKAAAEETLSEIEGMLENVNMCFIAAGMGGGTGTGAAPVIAEAARRMGVLTVGVVTKPFLFEGTRRMRAAEAGIEELQKHVDTLIVIPNQNLFLVAKAETTFKEAFQLADEVLQQGVRSITDLMVMPGLINLDFADVKSVMEEMGKAMMGTGEAEGENRALEAAERAIANPLLDGVSMTGAKGVIISIIGGEDMRLLEVDEAANHIRDLVDEDANIIWGSAFNPDLEGKIRVSVVATGIDATEENRATPARQNAGFGGGQPPRTPAAGTPDNDRGDLREGAAADFGAPAQPRFGRFDSDDSDGAEDSWSSDQSADDALADLRNEATGSASPAAATDDSPFAAPRSEQGYAAAQDRSARDESARTEKRPVYSDDDDTLDLAGTEAEAPRSFDRPNDTPQPGRGDTGSPQRQDRDELLLGDEAAESAAPQGEDDDRGGLLRRGRRRAEGEQAGDAPELARKNPSGGGTLFERMANLSRGGGSGESKNASRDDDDDDSDGALNIPRFLGRQNNQ